jgi:hypothetical protein
MFSVRAATGIGAGIMRISLSRLSSSDQQEKQQ